jgi:hypothetical protein
VKEENICHFKKVKHKETRLIDNYNWMGMRALGNP